MAEPVHHATLYREVAGIESGMVRLPEESRILRFRHLLEAHRLAARMLALANDTLRERGLMLKTGGTVVDATPISAPSSTKNASGKRDPRMNWYFGPTRNPSALQNRVATRTFQGFLSEIHFYGHTSQLWASKHESSLERVGGNYGKGWLRGPNFWLLQPAEASYLAGDVAAYGAVDTSTFP